MQLAVSESFHPMLAAKQADMGPGVQMMITELNNLVADQPEQVAAAMAAGTNVMGAEGKRIRPVLTETGYRLQGGRDTSMVARAAGVVEAWHTHLLVMDDTHDSAETRRNVDTAHVAMGKYLDKEGIGRNPQKLGTDAALTAGFIMHVHAGRTLDKLDVPREYREHAADIAAGCLIQTGIGQLRELTANPAKPPTPAEVLETYRLKTGVYTYFQSLAVGAALAGASPEQVKLFTTYTDAAGVAYQLRDDLLGVRLIGKQEDIGKPQNDIGQGTYTWIVTTALERAGTRSRNFLQESLGNTALTAEDLDQCNRILEQTEAVADAQTLVEKYTTQAVNALDAAPLYWPKPEVDFLRDLAAHGATRKT